MADVQHVDLVANQWLRGVQVRVACLSVDGPPISGGPSMFVTAPHLPAECPFRDGNEVEMLRFASLEEAFAASDDAGCTCGWLANPALMAARTIDPSCRYHAAAAAQPWNHRIPWNCPTYWDGCNCDGSDPLE